MLKDVEKVINLEGKNEDEKDFYGYVLRYLNLKQLYFL